MHYKIVVSSEIWFIFKMNRKITEKKNILYIFENTYIKSNVGNNKEN